METRQAGFRRLVHGGDVGRTVLSENGRIRGMNDGGECQRMKYQQKSFHGVPMDVLPASDWMAEKDKSIAAALEVAGS